MTAQELKRLLENFGEVEVEEERGRFTAIVVSPQFEGIDEGQRQHRVWGYVLDQAGSENATSIEFIFTYSPSEKSRLDRGEQLEEPYG